MMPISAIGAESRRDRGFTLVEVMITLLLLGLATGAVLLTLPADGPRLAPQAEGLAARIKHAQREAMLTNRAVELVLAAEDSHFRVHRAGRWTPLQEAPFEPRPWARGLAVTLRGTEGHGGIRFDPSGGTDPSLILLAAGEQAVEIRIDAQGGVTIHER